MNGQGLPTGGSFICDATNNQLINLDKFSITHNKFTTLPLQICDLINLKELYLSHNYFNTLPIKLEQLINLRVFFSYCNLKLQI